MFFLLLMKSAVGWKPNLGNTPGSGNRKKKTNYVGPEEATNQDHKAVNHVSCQFRKLRLWHYSDIVRLRKNVSLVVLVMANGSSF